MDILHKWIVMRGSEIITSLIGIVVPIMVHVISNLTMDCLVHILSVSIRVSVMLAGHFVISMAVVRLEVSLVFLGFRSVSAEGVIVRGSKIITSLVGVIVAIVVHIV